MGMGALLCVCGERVEKWKLSKVDGERTKVKLEKCDNVSMFETLGCTRTKSTGTLGRRFSEKSTEGENECKPSSML